MTDVLETQSTESNQSTENTVTDTTESDEQRAIASLLASVGVRNDDTENTGTTEAAETTEVTKEQVDNKEPKEPKETPEEKHERRQTQKLARRLKKEQEEFDKKRVQFESLLEKAKVDPVAYLAEQGITISEWASKQMETKDNKALRELERYKKEVAEKEAQNQKLQAEQYNRQLTMVVEQEFNLPKNLEKYTHINVLVKEGLVNQDFFAGIAQRLQEEFDETGVKPDIEKHFQEQEQELRKIYTVLSKAYKNDQTGNGPGKEKTISQASQTLSSKNTQVSAVNTESKSPEEIKAEIMQKYGIGKSYGTI